MLITSGPSDISSSPLSLSLCLSVCIVTQLSPTLNHTENKLQNRVRVVCGVSSGSDQLSVSWILCASCQGAMDGAYNV